MRVLDTVAAVSTPRGKGGIAVIRISGEGTAALAEKIFKSKQNPVAAPRRAVLGKICRPSGEVVDEGVAVFFAAPASFTGEDVLEISCHGGMLVTGAVLGAVLEAGARPADAGEFTARAMMNGKLSLSEAEALGALLDAGTAGQMALARGGMSGKLADAARSIYEGLALLLADVYAKIDFPDEDLMELGRDELAARLSELSDKTKALCATWQTGRAVSEGIKTVICGPVNAGKSTLYNALVGYDAAIVTDLAGTTRDIISETVSLGDVTLSLFDTAGLRETEDAVEKIGVQRARAALRDAELVLAVFDGSRPADEAARDLLLELQMLDATVIVVLNKQDKACLFESDLLANFAHVVTVSAAKGEISELRTLVERLYLSEKIDIRNDAVVANARQFAALSRGAEALDMSLEALSLDIPLDAACVEMERAMAAVGEVDGRAVGEDVVSEIFSHCCVGK